MESTLYATCIGPLRVTSTGEGQNVVFLHGLMTNGTVWTDVVDQVAAGARCVVIELPFGAHDKAMDPDADLSVTSVAEAVAGVLARACPNGYWIVASDTGGVVAQLMLCDHSGGIRGALLLPCDLYDNFLPIALRYLQWVAPVPGAMLLVRFVLEIRLIRSLPIAFGWLTRSGLSPELVRQTIDPLKDAGIRRDLVKLLRAIEPDITRRAASLLPQTTVPVRFLWATDDRLFPVRMARKLSDAMGPMSTWTEVDESYSFIQIDRPDAVTDGIDKMAGLGLRRNEASQ